MTLIISRQPQDTLTLKRLYFSVPGVPFLPIVTIVCNILLLLQLSPATWIRFGTWNGLGT
ncbi:unnamed protein product [Protopolystoma xenopodis]|uniref:Cationic amino acid transporter C-terminal domain-containing protein n=1 Tax=Protopolystoma xenopodis TaxID=117903 RepID=A0A448WN20_9PLAT|nr:unnamed protein product [Protopolystoma xenopodis]